MVMIVRIPETATLATAETLHASLMRVLQENEAVEVDCSNVVEADLTLVQLLLSAWRTAIAQSKSLLLSPPPSEALRQVLVQVGLVDGENSAFNTFWMGN